MERVSEKPIEEISEEKRVGRDGHKKIARHSHGGVSIEKALEGLIHV